MANVIIFSISFWEPFLIALLPESFVFNFYDKPSTNFKIISTSPATSTPCCHHDAHWGKAFARLGQGCSTSEKGGLITFGKAVQENTLTKVCCWWSMVHCVQGTCHSLGRATGTCGTYGCTCSDRWELIYKCNETSEGRFTCFCRKRVWGTIYALFACNFWTRRGWSCSPPAKRRGKALSRTRSAR